MLKPSSDVDSLDNLSAAQIELLDSLRTAGPQGIYWTEFLKLADSLGVNADDFGELVKKDLIKTKPGNIYVDPEFSQSAGESNPKP